MSCFLPARHPTAENRRNACRALGIPPGLPAALIWGEQNSLRYGKPGLRHETMADLHQRLPEPPPVGILLAAMQFAQALDLDDPFVGEAIRIIRVRGDDGSDVWLVDLHPAAVLLTAIRTGLYLPGRLEMRSAHGLGALATGSTRIDHAAAVWLEVSCQITWPRRSSDLADAERILQAAEVRVAQKALSPLLDGLPCLSIEEPILTPSLPVKPSWNWDSQPLLGDPPTN